MAENEEIRNIDRVIPQGHKTNCSYVLKSESCDCIYGEYLISKTVKTVKKATRNPTSFRYDILDAAFLHCMAEIGHYGAEKYGDLNWQLSRMSGSNGPINHIYDHLRQYRSGESHDKFGTRKHQLAAIAFNAMMEFWYLENMDGGE